MLLEKIKRQIPWCSSLNEMKYGYGGQYWWEMIDIEHCDRNSKINEGEGEMNGTAKR